MYSFFKFFSIDIFAISLFSLYAVVNLLFHDTGREWVLKTPQKMPSQTIAYTYYHFSTFKSSNLQQFLHFFKIFFRAKKMAFLLLFFNFEFIAWCFNYSVYRICGVLYGAIIHFYNRSILQKVDATYFYFYNVEPGAFLEVFD